MSAHTRLCVVTPYYKEDRSLLARCIASVARQGPAVDHLLVADGFPQPWLDALPLRHIKLDRAHGDYGNAARGLGALMAIAEDYAGIAFLDADNWYDDDHLASCLAAAAQGTDPAYVIAQRRFCRPDASTIAGTPSDVPVSEHVDTNCFLFLPAAFAVLHRWCTLPNALSAYGDQIFGKMLRAATLPSVLVPHRTVNYLCLSEAIYRLIGEEPPPGSKPSVQWADAQAWIYAQSPAGRRQLERLTGLTIERLAAPPLAEALVAPAGPDGLGVEIPGSSQPASIRRTEADIADYKRLFVAEAYGAVALPAEADLIVDLAAGIGLAALDLHRRYPQATVVAAEGHAEDFAILSGNMAGRSGCLAVQAHVSARPGAGQPTAMTLPDLLRSFAGRPVDILRLTPEQWRDMMASGPMALTGVRTVLIDGPAGPDCIRLSESADTAPPAVSVPAAA